MLSDQKQGAPVPGFSGSTPAPGGKPRHSSPGGAAYVSPGRKSWVASAKQEQVPEGRHNPLSWRAVEKGDWSRRRKRPVCRRFHLEKDRGLGVDGSPPSQLCTGFELSYAAHL